MIREEDRFAVGLLAVCALGLVLRALHLDIPLRYDEAVTYTQYASGGWRVATTTYATPNNHVFHSLLVGWLTGWLGAAPVVIRLPAFFAGCMLVPLTAWVAFQAHGRAAGMVAAAVVATSPVLVEFSTNARGYTLLAVAVLLAVGIGQRLLEKGSVILWVALVEAGVMGLYTLPIMAIPWAGITLWLAVNLAAREGTRGERARRLGALAAANVAVAVVTAALYSGIVLHEGMEALTGNRFVEEQPLGGFLAAAPAAARDVLAHWGRGVPWPLAALVGAVAVAGLTLGPRRRRLSLAVALAAGAAAAMLVVRNHGEARIWLWALPLAAVAAGVGVAELARRWGEARVGPAASWAATAWAAATTAWILLAQPVRASTETGTFPEVEDVVEGMAGYFRDGDAVLSDFVSAEPLLYYVARYHLGQESQEGADDAVERSWVVVNRRDPERARGLEERLARMGAPPLEGSTPVFTAGMAEVYLFGRPVSAPDPRLLEAVDWYTGVAGQVDDRRARDLLQQVLDETDSALASMWLARCHARGRMGFEENRPVADALAASVVQEVRELAQTGEPEAQFLLGSAHAEGLGVEANPVEAVDWYRTAAGAGHVLAMHNLGNAYAAGEGVEADPAVAVFWWRRAAEAGDAVTQLRLGEAYEEGRGVERSVEEARAWYARASRRGNAEARAALARLGG